MHEELNTVLWALWTD